MDMLAALKLQRIFDHLPVQTKHAILIDMLPILHKRLAPAEVKDAIEALRDLLR